MGATVFYFLGGALACAIPGLLGILAGATIDFVCYCTSSKIWFGCWFCVDWLVKMSEIIWTIFIIGEGMITTFLEESVKHIPSIWNEKVVAFLPRKHIFTAIALVLFVMGFCFYGLLPREKGRIIALIFFIFALILLAVVIVIDIVLLVKNMKRK